MSELSYDIIKLGVMKQELSTLENEVEDRILSITKRIFHVLKGGYVDRYNEIYYDYVKGTITVENYTRWSGGNDNRDSESNPPVTLSIIEIDSFKDEVYFNEYLNKLKIRVEAKKTTWGRRRARLNERLAREIEQAKRDEMMDIAKTLGIIPTEKQLEMLLSLRT